MAKPGTFDATQVAKAWFDPTQSGGKGWFDYGMPFEHDLLGTVQSAVFDPALFPRVIESFYRGPLRRPEGTVHPLEWLPGIFAGPEFQRVAAGSALASFRTAERPRYAGQGTPTVDWINVPTFEPAIIGEKGTMGERTQGRRYRPAGDSMPLEWLTGTLGTPPFRWAGPDALWRSERTRPAFGRPGGTELVPMEWFTGTVGTPPFQWAGPEALPRHERTRDRFGRPGGTELMTVDWLQGTFADQAQVWPAIRMSLAAFRTAQVTEWGGDSSGVVGLPDAANYFAALHPLRESYRTATRPQYAGPGTPVVDWITTVLTSVFEAATLPREIDAAQWRAPMWIPIGQPHQVTWLAGTFAAPEFQWAGPDALWRSERTRGPVGRPGGTDLAAMDWLRGPFGDQERFWPAIRSWAERTRPIVPPRIVDGWPEGWWPQVPAFDPITYPWGVVGEHRPQGRQSRDTVGLEGWWIPTFPAFDPVNAASLLLTSFRTGQSMEWSGDSGFVVGLPVTLDPATVTGLWAQMHTFRTRPAPPNRLPYQGDYEFFWFYTFEDLVPVFFPGPDALWRSERVRANPTWRTRGYGPSELFTATLPAFDPALWIATQGVASFYPKPIPLGLRDEQWQTAWWDVNPPSPTPQGVYIPIYRPRRR